jgi:deoxyadenosine/deoxycytidine kinase
VHARLDIEAPKPDLVIYLQAPVDVLIERISRRGIRYEQSIDRAYLERLTEAYAKFFHDYAESPLLIVNAAQVDFVGNDGDFAQLFAQLERIRRGRHYFNPMVLK